MTTKETLRPEPPPTGRIQEVAPGLMSLRLPLPYALDHVNVYLLEDAGGWALFDTGLGDMPTRALWEEILRGQLGGRPITRLIASHSHPDHMGLVGWMQERFAAPLLMTAGEHAMAARFRAFCEPSAVGMHRAFYHACGLPPAMLERMLARGHNYLRHTTGLPEEYIPLRAGMALEVGGRSWRVLTGGGHAPEQAMLCCEADRLFLAADQVIAGISPNVSVFAFDPEADPLSDYLRSLSALREEVAPDMLVLAGHRQPFRTLHQRAEELQAHHAERCALIAEACRAAARSCAELVPVLFHRSLDEHQMSFAIGETLAHLNHMVRRGDLRAEARPDGVLVYHPL